MKTMKIVYASTVNQYSELVKFELENSLSGRGFFVGGKRHFGTASFFHPKTNEKVAWVTRNGLLLSEMEVPFDVGTIKAKRRELLSKLNESSLSVPLNKVCFISVDAKYLQGSSLIAATLGIKQSEDLEMHNNIKKIRRYFGA